MDEPEAIRNFDEPKLAGLVEMMVLAASADGDFASEERERLVRNVVTLTSRRIAGDKLDSLLGEISRRIEAEGRAPRLAAVAAELGDLATRKVALDLALTVMAEDQILRTAERELIMEIADAFAIDRAEAADMVKAVENRSAK